MLEYPLTLCETLGSESWGIGGVRIPTHLPYETLESESRGLQGFRIPTYPM